MRDPRDAERRAAEYAEAEQSDNENGCDAWEPTYRDGTPKCECWDSSEA